MLHVPRRSHMPVRRAVEKADLRIGRLEAGPARVLVTDRARQVEVAEAVVFHERRADLQRTPRSSSAQRRCP